MNYPTISNEMVKLLLIYGRNVLYLFISLSIFIWSPHWHQSRHILNEIQTRYILQVRSCGLTCYCYVLILNTLLVKWEDHKQQTAFIPAITLILTLMMTIEMINDSQHRCGHHITLRTFKHDGYHLYTAVLFLIFIHACFVAKLLIVHCKLFCNRPRPTINNYVEKI